MLLCNFAIVNAVISRPQIHRHFLSFRIRHHHRDPNIGPDHQVWTARGKSFLVLIEGVGRVQACIRPLKCGPFTPLALMKSADRFPFTPSRLLRSAPNWGFIHTNRYPFQAGHRLLRPDSL